MKRKPAKQTKPTKSNANPDKNMFTSTEVGALIDQLRGEFKVFGERQEAVAKKVDATYEQVGKNTGEITLLKVAVKGMTAKIEALTESIDKLIKTKADREDLQTLDKRLSVLETKVEALSK